MAVYCAREQHYKSPISAQSSVLPFQHHGHPFTGSPFHFQHFSFPLLFAFSYKYPRFYSSRVSRAKIYCQLLAASLLGTGPKLCPIHMFLFINDFQPWKTPPSHFSLWVCQGASHHIVNTSGEHNYILVCHFGNHSQRLGYTNWSGVARAPKYTRHVLGSVLRCRPRPRTISTAGACLRSQAGVGVFMGQSANSSSIGSNIPSLTPASGSCHARGVKLGVSSLVLNHY